MLKFLKVQICNKGDEMILKTQFRLSFPALQICFRPVTELISEV